LGVADPSIQRRCHNARDTRRTIETYRRCQSTYGFSKWAVLMKATGELVGDSGLLPMNDVPEFELGYRFAKGFWSLGLATECGRAWLRTAFFHLNLERVFAHPDEATTRPSGSCGSWGWCSTGERASRG